MCCELNLNLLNLTFYILYLLYITVQYMLNISIYTSYSIRICILMSICICTSKYYEYIIYFIGVLSNVTLYTVIPQLSLFLASLAIKTEI